MTQAEEIIRWGKELFDRRLIAGWGGNLSCRVGDDEFLITSQHSALGFLDARDVVRINGKGEPIVAGQRASSETPMHMAIYQGNDAQAIVHVHPPLVVAFSLSHDRFVPVSFEEKYTLGEVRVIAQETPTVTDPTAVVEELKYCQAVILKGHGTVAIGKDLKEAFLVTDLLEEAVHCHLSSQMSDNVNTAPSAATRHAAKGTPASGPRHTMFSRAHMQALIDCANGDEEFRAFGSRTGLTTSLTLELEDNGTCWTVDFDSGEITGFNEDANGAFLISGKAEWWKAVFTKRIDPFLATQQGKLKLKRGELAHLSRWYKPFQKAFSLWQTVPIQ